MEQSTTRIVALCEPSEAMAADLAGKDFCEVAACLVRGQWPSSGDVSCRDRAPGFRWIGHAACLWRNDSFVCF